VAVLKGGDVSAAAAVAGTVSVFGVSGVKNANTGGHVVILGGTVALGGSVGSLLGTAAALAIPGVGPMVAPLVAGAGGMAGGLAGQALAGGSPSMTQGLGYGIQGAQAGYQYGKAGELSQSVESGAQGNLSPSNAPVAEVDGLAKRITPMIQSNPLAPPPGMGGGPLSDMVTGQQLRGPNPNAPASAFGGSAPPTMGSSALVAQTQPKQGFFKRFANNLGGLTGMQQPKLTRLPDGTVVYDRSWE
jgi:hypothetical protein